MASVAAAEKKDTVMENAEKKRKNAEPDTFADAQEEHREDEASTTGSAQSSSLPGSASTTGAPVQTPFEITVLAMLKEAKEEQRAITGKTDKNLAAIIEFNTKVDEGRRKMWHWERELTHRANTSNVWPPGC